MTVIYLKNAYVPLNVSRIFFMDSGFLSRFGRLRGDMQFAAWTLNFIQELDY